MSAPSSPTGSPRTVHVDLTDYSLQSATLTDISRNLPKAAAFYDSKIKVSMGNGAEAIPVERIWKRLEVLAKEQSRWNFVQEGAFVAAVNKLDELSDAGYERFKNQVDPELYWFFCGCCWCRCPSRAEMKAKSLAASIERKHGSTTHYSENLDGSALLDSPSEKL